MHKLPAFVFKLLGTSLVLMFLLDTSLVVVDTITVHSRVTNLAGIMQNEIARNNGMPTELAEGFMGQLNTIVQQSRVADDNGVTTNLTSNAGSYNSLSPSNNYQYGDIIDLYIELSMSPGVVYFNTHGDDRGTVGMLTKGVINYDLTYHYSVPCLRYLK